MPLYETVMQYHVESSEEEEEEEDNSNHFEDKKFLLSSRHVRNKIYANKAAYDEIDGNVSHRYRSPLTIIQVKNPSKNLDGSDQFTVFPSGIIRFILLASLIGFTTLIVGVLAWHLPCSSCASVYSSPNNPFTQSFTSRNEWVITFDDLVLISGLEVVSSSVIVSGYKENQSSFGMMGLIPASGEILWKRRLPSLVLKHGCQLIDVNEDGVKDCIISGESGLLAAINPLNGAELWYTRHHIPLTNLSLPRKLPDLNNDSVPELLSACAVTLPSGVRDHRKHVRNNLVLISGKTGKVIGRPYLIQECTDLGAVNLTSKLAIQFDCTSSIGPDQFEMSLEEFYAKTAEKELPASLSDLPTGSEYYQFESVGVDSPETIRDSIHLDVSPLKFNCPECGVVVKIWDGFAHRVLWSRSWRNAVAFQPLSTRYETDRWDSPIEGFVFRLWEWDSPLDTFNREGRLFPSAPHYQRRSQIEGEEENDDFVIRILNLTETIFYATLNHTKPQVLSLLSHRIQQKCIKSFKGLKFECSPHFNTHPNAMVIVTKDSKEDSRDLVVASHSVIREKRWALQTSLRKKRLQKNIYSMSLS